MDGIIIINKTKGFTSHDIVAKVKKILQVSKVGHTGTLDPNATGVLPILLGQGTKLSKYLINHDKIYSVTLALGIKTDTADGEGNVIEKSKIDENKITIPKVENVLSSFIGKQRQKPPMYSAIKIKGKKLYEYARKGIEIEVESREIQIYSITLLNIVNNEIQFEVSCSKGTYIRSLCEDIAEKLGTIGYMKELNRIKVGEFSIQEAISLEELEQRKKDNNLEETIITVENFFKNSTKIILSQKELTLFLNGVKLNTKNPDGLCTIYNEQNIFIGLGVISKQLLKRDIIVNDKG